MTNGSLMKVKSIAECSPWSILQYFWLVLLENQFSVFLRVAVLHKFYCKYIPYRAFFYTTEFVFDNCPCFFVMTVEISGCESVLGFVTPFAHVTSLAHLIRHNLMRTCNIILPMQCPVPSESYYCMTFHACFLSIWLCWPQTE